MSASMSNVLETGEAEGMADGSADTGVGERRRSRPFRRRRGLVVGEELTGVVFDGARTGESIPAALGCGWACCTVTGVSLTALAAVSKETTDGWICARSPDVLRRDARPMPRATSTIPTAASLTVRRARGREPTLGADV